jgi:hypothetical protein
MTERDASRILRASVEGPVDRNRAIMTGPITLTPMA